MVSREDESKLFTVEVKKHPDFQSAAGFPDFASQALDPEPRHADSSLIEVDDFLDGGFGGFFDRAIEFPHLLEEGG